MLFFEFQRSFCHRLCEHTVAVCLDLAMGRPGGGVNGIPDFMGEIRKFESKRLQTEPVIRSGGRTTNSIKRARDNNMLKDRPLPRDSQAACSHAISTCPTAHQTSTVTGNFLCAVPKKDTEIDGA